MADVLGEIRAGVGGLLSGRRSAKVLKSECVQNSMKTILHLCADTGSDSKPYQDAGYNVILVGKDIGVEHSNPDP